MPSGSDGASGTEASELGGGSISTQLAHLVPSFDPSKDDLQLYQQKVQLVFAVWPPSKISELITRLILNTSGTAFSKLQLHQVELCVNEEKGIRRLIELLGGHWGRTSLERRYADAEKALFQCSQLGDESHDSYLARADVLWTRLMTQKLSLEDLQAYVTLRGAQLSHEDKKRVIIDSDNSLEGKLTMVKVSESIRMLGTTFFQEMTGANKKGVKAKVYDQSLLVAEDVEHSGDHEDSIHATGHDEVAEDEFIENLAHEGDEDAVFVADFETAATDVVQADEDLAAAFSMYMEARRKLSEKYRSRGFWPLTTKGKSKGYKGKFKGKPAWNNRKTLQQRILESNCRICGRKGHWKSECPNRGSTASNASASTVPVTLSMGVASTTANDAMSAEFLSLPEVQVPMQDSVETHASSFVQIVLFSAKGDQDSQGKSNNMRDVRERINNRIKGNRGNNSIVTSLVNRIESRLSSPSDRPEANRHASVYRTSVLSTKCPQMPSSFHASRAILERPKAPQVDKPKSPMPGETPETAEVLFATHDTWGIIDTGATKTVMGSEFVPGFLNSVHASVRDKIQRCPCDVTFRFGNQGILKSEHAMVVPVCGFDLKIAIVPGATPFLVSNTLLRALEALVDTSANQLILPKFNQQIPLKLTNKGLYLLDMNLLFQVSTQKTGSKMTAETFAQETTENDADPRVAQQVDQKARSGTSQNNEDQSFSDRSSSMQNLPSTCVTPNFLIHSTQKIQSTSHEALPKPVSHVQFQENLPMKSMGSPETQEKAHRVHSLETLPGHDGLDQTSPACAVRDAQSRDRECRSHDPGDAPSREGAVRKGTPREDIHRGVGISSRLDQVVPGPLPGQSERRAQEGDPLHQAQDRSHGIGRSWGSESAPSAAQEQSCAQVADGEIQEPSSTTSGCLPGGAYQHRDGHHAGEDDKPRTGPEPDLGAPDTERASQSSAVDDERRSTGAPSGIGMGGPMGSLSDSEGDRNWALIAGEIDEFTTSCSNHEQVHFQRLVTMMEKELKICEEGTKVKGPQLDLLEVFCSDNSTLTDQTNRLGGNAMRFGLSQGNLQTSEGRKKVFDAVCRYRPKHVWVSPTCKPWSKWSNLNCQKSLELWDRIHAERKDMLSQVALCVVLCRHQHRCKRHAHWEQPKGSHMFMLPYLSELDRYMVSAKPDMCIAGGLQDPSNEKPMKKGMHIRTTSQSMQALLDPLRCTGSHDHQPIEGSTSVHGHGIARSVFSERYPRKFARLIAKQILKKTFPMELPVGAIADQALLAVDQWFQISSAFAADARMAKRAKMSQPSSKKATSADRSLSSPESGKRRRFKQPEQDSTDLSDNSSFPPKVQDQLNEIMGLVEPILPRVGKKLLDQPQIMQKIQECFPEKVIKGIIACKGTERTMAPPSNLGYREAPYRRAIMKLRGTGKVFLEEWEKYDELSKRKIIRKSQPCRVNITVFAANPVQVPDATSRQNAETPGVNDAGSPSRMESPDQPQDSEIIEPMLEKAHELESHNETQRVSKPSAQHMDLPVSESSIQMDSSVPSVRHNRFLALPQEEQSMLRRAHQNLCHPSPEQLSSVLRSQGVRPEISQAVFDMECATCASQKMPKIARPSTLKYELDFNDKVFIDGITWTSKAGKTFHFYHLLDQATNYHVATPAPSRAAEQAAQSVAESWFQWAGPPNLIVTDAGTEFTSEHFSEFLQRYDVKSVTAAPHAHWQNGRSERHGQILQSMLHKIDHEMPIQTYVDLQRALVQCTHAKNTLSIRKGYSPEVLVFGKGSRVPGSISSCEAVSSLASADREDAHGIAFRKSLELRERARKAFHEADNDQALRRACLRRSRPDRRAYDPGEWVMLWQPQINGGHWFGPHKVVALEKSNSLWATQGGKLYRRALEHVRPVCSSEAQQIPHDTIQNQTPPSTQNPIPEVIPSENNPQDHNPNTTNNPQDNQSNADENSQSQDQPDTEPETNNPNHEPGSSQMSDPAVETPVPETSSEDGLVTTHLLCCEDVIMPIDPTEVPCAWKCELEVPQWMDPNQTDNWTPDEILLATTEKKQRTEVKLSMLTPEEQKAFSQAKDTEIHNWLKTGTVSRILRSKLAPEQILRCRWILTWKPRDDLSPDESTKGNQLKTHKPKARLVVLGYMDPNLTEVPRDSPTLGKQSKMVLLQLISSMGWSLGSFDIKAAFLQGKPQKDRVMGLEPVSELARAMSLNPGEICKLDKSAYGLIDAPFLWFQTLQEELIGLGFMPCPFDPCVFVLREPKSQKLSGILGIHVDDGIYGGDQYFQDQIAKLESKYPFGSKKSKNFTFTGIDLKQNPDNSIELSQSKYVKNINPITITTERRAQENEPVTEEERHLLRGLIGSLQYAAVHTRPDLTSALSQLQSQINSAKVTTLIMANKTLHTAKKHNDVTIKINPIHIKDLRFLAFSDASFASKVKPESYAGMIIMATHKEISQNKSCVISPLSWGTKKIQRVVTSTLSAEATALATTLDQLTWIRVYWAWLIDPKITWQKPETIKTLPEAMTVPTMKVDEKDLAITDCTTRTAVPSCQEFRTQLLARSIKDILSENIRLHWVHSGAQLADALTKIMESQFLRETLRQGYYCLHDADEVLKNRANARNRIKWLRSTASEMSSRQF